MKLRNLIKENSYSNGTYEIIDSKFIPPHKSSTIYDLSKVDIQNILNGMRPNMSRSEDNKVKYGWTFKFNNAKIGIWDYKDSSKDNIFSAYGNEGDLITLFGKDHVQTFHINHINDKKKSYGQ